MSSLPPERPGCPARNARPRPDPEAVRVCQVPDPAPPYDAHTPEDGAGRDADAGRDTGDSTESVPAGEGEAGPGAGPGGREPGWPSRFAQVLAETLAGSRPPRQLTPWTTERARHHIQRLGPRLASGQQPQVRTVVTSQPRADVMELTMVVGFGPRVRAVAVRLEREAPSAGRAGRQPRAARWRCTHVEAA